MFNLLKHTLLIITILFSGILLYGEYNVISFSGSVELIRDGKSMEVTESMKLLETDTIKTEVNGFLTIIFSNGDEYEIGPGSEILLSQFISDNIEKDTSSWLSALKSKVSKIVGKSEAKELSAVCGVRGNEVGENRFKVYWETGEVDASEEYDRCRTLFFNRYYSEAIDMTSKFVADYPGQSEKANYIIGRSYFEVSNYDEAIKFLKEADKQEEDVEFYIALSYLYSADFNKAVDGFEKILSTYSDKSKIAYFLAISYKGLGDSRKSKQYLKKIDKDSEYFNLKI